MTKIIQMINYRAQGLNYYFSAVGFDNIEEAEDWADKWCDDNRPYFPRALVRTEDGKVWVDCVRANTTGD
jgi:hypothetical protein